jgi:uncharacterized protein (TIGR03905 family)
MLRRFRYRNEGTCSSGVSFVIAEGKIFDVEFEGGCSGNLRGISSLVDGMELGEVLRRLSGIRCGDKVSSCPDQLAKAIELARAGRGAG